MPDSNWANCQIGRRIVGTVNSKDRIKSVLVTVACALISWLVCELVFQWFAAGFETDRNVRTEFAYHWIPIVPMLFLVSFGYAGLVSRQILVANAGGLLLSFLASFRTFSWSGPEDMYRSIEPLLQVQTNLQILLFVVNAILLLALTALTSNLSRLKGDHKSPAVSV